MEDIRNLTAVPQIVKIVRMVVKFHPLLTITSLIFGIIFLQRWIEEELSKQWKILKVYCQSTMRTLLDLITKKMNNLSEALQMHLNNKAAKVQLMAQLIGQFALFSATLLLLDTEFSLKYDKRGTKTLLLLLIGRHLLIRSNIWSRFQILRRRYGCTENSISNFTFFILALLFANFYDNSLRSLGSMLCIAIYLLCLLVVLRPRTDFELFSFIIGIVGSITYNQFKFKFPTWIIASICFVLLSFKSWLDKYWLDLEQDLSTNTTTESTNMILILSSTIMYVTQVFLASTVVKSPLSDYKDWLVRAIGSTIWRARFNKFYLKDSSLPFINATGISSLILTVVNVAQGMFMFAFTISPMADYKYWLFVVIIYGVFFFWLHRFLHKEMPPPSTNTKGITSMILSLQSMATCDIMVLSGLEPHLHYEDWLVWIIFYMLWWVRLYIVISQRSLTIHHS